MRLRQLCLSLAVIAAAGFSACSGNGAGTTAPAPQTPLDTLPPQIQREMRGLWIATVANIDWPSRTGSRLRSSRQSSWTSWTGRRPRDSMR